MNTSKKSRSQSNKVRKMVLILSLYVTTLFLSFSQSHGAIEFYHPDTEADLYMLGLENQTMVWQIDDSYGVFGDYSLHPNSQFKYYVYDTDLDHNRYLVNSSSYDWTSLAWSNWSDAVVSDYFLSKRDWGSIAVDILLEEDSLYWGSKATIDERYGISYDAEWINGILRSTVTISYYMNSTNYDIAKYAREEGLLLYRETKVQIINGTGPKDDLEGYRRISLLSNTAGLAINFWHWIIWIVIIFVAVLAVLLTISTIVARRKRVYREIAEI